MNAEQIARVAHEVNRAYCLAIGDASQPSWEQAPNWQRESAMAGVTAHLEEARSPRESHALWMAQKVSDGWVYGEVKDATAKTHPCLVAYEELPQEQRVKDYLFGAVVESLKSAAATPSCECIGDYVLAGGKLVPGVVILCPHLGEF